MVDKNELVSNCPVKGKRSGIAAIDYNGDRYCVDCAKKVLDGESFGYETKTGNWESVENANGEEIVNKLISGEIYTLSMGGVMLAGKESPLMHCGLGENCENSIKDHPYNHNCEIGGILDLTYMDI